MDHAKPLPHNPQSHSLFAKPQPARPPRLWLMLGLIIAGQNACSASLSSPPAGNNVPVPATTDTAAPAATPNVPFAGLAQVSVDELFGELETLLPGLAASPVLKQDFRTLLPNVDPAQDVALFQDYLRIRLAFETTRAGGLWGIAWQVTDQEPRSDRIWQQWRALRIGDGDALPDVTAIAECDELSALFAFTAHRLGLSKRSQVGLFWPTSNHTVAVWSFDTKAGSQRVVVPTSQIFLDPRQTLGTRGFDPSRQKNIHDYRRADISGQTALPAALARQFVLAAARVADTPQDRLQTSRNQREQQQWRQLQR